MQFIFLIKINNLYHFSLTSINICQFLRLFLKNLSLVYTLKYHKYYAWMNEYTYH